MPRKRANGQGGVFQTYMLDHAGKRVLKSAVWYASYRKDGKRFCKSTGETVKARAEAVLRDWMTDSARGLKPTPETTALTYDHLRESLLDHYRRNGLKSLQVTSYGEETIFPLPALDEFFTGKKVADITPDTVRGFIKKRQHDGAGNAAINNSLSLLRRMFSIARQEGRLTLVPFVGLLKKPPARQGFIGEEKFAELFAALPDHLKPLILFLYRCGGRVGEALEIDWSQVDMRAATITFRAEQTKDEESRIVPLPDELISMLRAVKVKEGLVFSGENLRWSWNRACVAAGVGKFIPTGDPRHPNRYEGLTIHDLRRSALSNFRKQHVPEAVAMRFSGHASRAVFDRYSIVDVDEQRAAMKKVEQHTAPTAPRRPRRVGRLLGVGRG